MSTPTRLTFKKRDKPKLTLKKKVTLSKPLVRPKRAKKTLAPKKSSLVFMDASYFIFYRYHATKAWYRHRDKELHECNIDNEEFVISFARHFNSWTEKIAKKFKTTTDKFFWFKDAPKDTVWRTPLFPNYKSTREEKTDEGITGFFPYCFEHLIPKDRVIYVPRAEADDVAAIATHYENETNPDQKIAIFTGDTDYLQLVNENTMVVKAPKLEQLPIQIKIGKEKLQVSPDVYIRHKFLVGDVTDEIPKVYHGCGPRIAYQMVNDPILFKKNITDHPERNARYQENKTLICFDQIPDDIRAEGIAVYNKVRNSI